MDTGQPDVLACASFLVEQVSNMPKRIEPAIYPASIGAGKLSPTCQRRPLPSEPNAREPVGRYDRQRENTWHPADGLGRMPRSRNDDTTTAAVPDPYAIKDERILATVNRRVDVLEYERSRGLISEGAYRTGRIVQAVLERCAGNVGGGSNWCGSSRADPALAHELNMMRALSNAELVDAYLKRICSRLGVIDTTLLRRILGEGRSFADCAALQGKSGDRGERYVAARYREALEDLTEAWTARGAVQPTPGDKHAAAAATDMPGRQDAAVVGGATLRRLEGELTGAITTGKMADGDKATPARLDELRKKIAGLRLGQGFARARRTEVRR